MKKLTCFILTPLIFWCLQACQKSGNNEPIAPPPHDSTNTNPPVVVTNPPTNKQDSVILLTKVVSTGNPGTLLFIYDNQNRLKQIQKPFNNAPSILSSIYYQNEKISTIISGGGSYNSDKCPAIFYYNTNNRCNKVIYKRPSCCMTEDNPYYHTVTNSYDINSYDTITYTTSEQISLITRYGNDGRFIQSVRFLYNSTSDTIPFQLEKTYPSGDKYGLLIYTNSMVHPASRQMWFMTFVAYTTFLSYTSFFVSLPLLFDDRGNHELDEYLSFFSKCITTYKTSKNGQWTSGLGGFVYSYSKDSLTFQGSVPNVWPDVTAKFTFTKVKG